MSRPRGYAAWRPQRATQVLLAQIDEVLVEYRDYLPLTVRQIFYRLVGRYGYPKDELGYGRLCEHLNRARRARLIPFDHIRDDGVSIIRRDYFADTHDFWDDTGRRARLYRRDRLAGQAVRLELWCEAAGMMPQLDRVAREFSVPVYSAGGFASVTGTHDIAERALQRSLPTVILHVGDFDPSGESIFQAMIEDASAFVERDRLTLDMTLEGVRVALTQQQVQAFGLPTAPPKKTDSRARGWVETCQAEALPPDDLAQLVQNAIVLEIDVDDWQEQVNLEAEDRQTLLLSLPSGDNE